MKNVMFYAGKCLTLHGVFLQLGRYSGSTVGINSFYVTHVGCRLVIGMVESRGVVHAIMKLGGNIRNERTIFEVVWLSGGT